MKLNLCLKVILKKKHLILKKSAQNGSLKIDEIIAREFCVS